MMRRFSRRRRGGSREGGDPIDAASALARLIEAGTIPAASLAPLEADEVPADLAVIGTGEAKSGGRILVAFSPRSASHAVLAALAVGGRLAEVEKFDGEFWVVAPEWTGPGRRVLGLAGQLPYRLIPATGPSAGSDRAIVSAEAQTPATVLSVRQIAGHLARPADRDLFLRAARGLEGLAAKHGGALRGYGRAVEFVLLARRIAELRADDGGVSLVTTSPQRSTVRLASESLSSTLDGFEGQLRKRLGDRRVREGEEGFRARAIGAFRNWHSLRAMVAWPLGGSDNELIDWVGVDVEGRPVVGAVREKLGLRGLAEILEATHQLQGSLPSVLDHAAPPVILDHPRLVVGGRVIEAGVGRVLDALVLGHELFEVRGSGADLELNAVAAGDAPQRERPSRRRSEGRRRPDGVRDVAEPSDADASEPGSGPELEAEADAEPGERSSRGRGRGRGRGRRSRGGRGRGEGANGGRDAKDSENGSSAGSDDSNDVAARPAARFDEVSLFDLDDEPSDRESASGGGSRRGRGRGRGRRRGRSGSSDEGGSRGSSEGTTASEAPEGARSERRRGPRDLNSEDDSEVDDKLDLVAGVDVGDASDPDAFLEDVDLELEDVPEDVSDFEAPVAPTYEDDEEIAEEGGGAATARDNRRPGRRGTPQETVVEEPRLPRRRGAIIAHADRDSLAAAILIARDIRMIEGIWIYPQSELMSVFRGVTTDLRDDTPIYMVGFTPSPARDVLQAASLYRGRIQWFDHHDWPPEDLQGLKDAIGADAVSLAPGSGSSLPPVLEACSRRSRFTDKLVDLIAARFSHHDYERWGRLWWKRLGEIAAKTGDRRADVELLLSGRPSDLANEAAGVETPEIPPEVSFVSHRDFRLVHFAGYALVVVEVPVELDVHLTARVARERYGAQLSLAYHPDDELIIFAGDELEGRRSLDLGSLVEHVTQKLTGVEALPDTDHVARMRVRGRAEHPERLDDIVAEIAMGRSTLER